MAMVEMGDFVGAVLKYLARHPIPRLTMVGGIGKFSKLAAGRLDTHSRKGGVDFEFLAREAAAAGASPELQQSVAASNTALEAALTCRDAGVPLAERLCALAWEVARSYLPEDIALEVWAIDKPGNVIGTAGSLERG
jgi:cobalt-precorrin-5B (C1)-methyltransferase